MCIVPGWRGIYSEYSVADILNIRYWTEYNFCYIDKWAQSWEWGWGYSYDFYPGSFGGIFSFRVSSFICNTDILSFTLTHLWGFLSTEKFKKQSQNVLDYQESRCDGKRELLESKRLGLRLLKMWTLPTCCWILSKHYLQDAKTFFKIYP